MDKKLFGTSGIRGNAEELFTSQFCYDIALTFIEFLRGHGELGPIAVGMDPRKSGPRIKEDLLSGLSGGSVPLFDEGITPIPSINWLLLATEIKAAIMITGSHIAPELNGVKFYAHNEEISASDMEEIESLYEENKNKGGSSLEVVVKKETRAKDLYKKMLVEQINLKLPKWKIAVDCANGAQTVVFPDLLGELGFEVVKINCSTEKDFIARDTDTDDKAEIEELKKAVVSEKCDFGIAFDGDGDRSVFIDETGEFVTGEYSCTLIANHLPGSSVVTTVAASQVVDSIKKSVYKTKVGSPYVIGEMKKRRANFGFEQNGGAIFGEKMYTRDGGSVVMTMLGIFSKFGGTFSEMVGELPKYYMHRTKVDYKWEQQEEILKKAKEKFGSSKIDETDGLKIWIDSDTWLLFRSSQNAPEFRVFAESKDNDKAKKLLEEGIRLVTKIAAND